MNFSYSKYRPNEYSLSSVVKSIMLRNTNYDAF